METCKDVKNLTATDFPTARTPDACEDCLVEGTGRVELRECRECGHVGCCDSSPRKHATAHFKKSGHPVIRTLQPGETWTWCYVHELQGELAAAPLPAQAAGTTTK